MVGKLATLLKSKRIPNQVWKTELLMVLLILGNNIILQKQG